MEKGRLRRRIILYGSAFVVVSLLCLYLFRLREADVVWIGSQAYDQRVKDFSVTREMALDIALSKKRRDILIMTEDPPYILRQWYYFGYADKIGNSETAGFYVNGYDGRLLVIDENIKLRKGVRSHPFVERFSGKDE